MKKIRIIRLIVSVTMIFLIFCGCQQKPTLDDLGEEKIQEIRQCWINENNYTTQEKQDAVVITAYYGCFSGNIVFGLKYPSAYLMEKEKHYIDGVFIYEGDPSLFPYVYLDPGEEYAHNRILRLNVAYDKGYIEKAELRTISKNMK